MSSRQHPAVETLDSRCVPALIASELTLNPPLLAASDVQGLLARASVATSSNDGIIAVVDRAGNILGVHVESGVSTAITGDPEKLDFAIDGAIAKARTAAFFANDTAPLTSRTIQEISQTTITQREVESDPDLASPDSPLQGPGLVAPIGIKGHFPPNVAFTPQVDLFGIEDTNRDSFLQPGLDGTKGTADDVPLSTDVGRFNVPLADIPAGQGMNPPLAYGEALLTPDEQRDPTINHFQSRGIATLPGGIPLYKDRTLVGGIGVFYPGTTGYADAENSSLSVNYDATKPDRTLEAEFAALAAAGGSSEAGFPVGNLPGAPAIPGFDVPNGRIDLVGITLDVIGPGGTQGPSNLVQYATANLGIGGGVYDVAGDKPVDPGGDLYLAGQQVPDGWLVTPHDGVGMTADQVRQIIQQGIDTANQIRAQIRLPDDERTRMVFAVADKTGQILGLYRMPDATVFSIDVAVAKARNTAYYDDASELQAIDEVPGLPPGTAITNRTVRYLSLPRFPESVDGEPPGPFSNLNDPGIDPRTGLNTGAPLPLSAYTSVQGYDAFHVGTNFRDPDDPENQNGIVFFPGSSGVYVAGSLVGGFGVSGDGVDQDDTVTSGGIGGFDAPSAITADNYFVSGVRLPYFKFPRNPQG